MKNLMIGVIVLALDIIIFGVLLSNNESVMKLGNGNLIIYALIVLVFIILYVLSILFIKRFIRVDIFERTMVKKLVCVFITFVLVISLLNSYINEVNIFGTDSANFIWHRLPDYLTISFMLALACLFIFYVRNVEYSAKNNYIYILYFIIAFAVGYSLCIPNYFNADVYHGNAYANSIYGIMNNATYSDIFTSIYGHYAILLRVPLEIMGHNMRAVAILSAIIGGVSIFLANMALHNISENTFIRIVGSISMALPIVGLRLTNYWQVQPHRIIFPAILFYVTSIFIKNKLVRRQRIIGHLISVLAIIWNTETGVICAVAWAGLIIFDSICENKENIIKILKSCIQQGIWVVCDFFMAFGIVNIYNVALGGEFNNLKSFLFPLFTLTDIVRYNLPKIMSTYMFELLLFAIVIAWLLSKYIFSTEKYSWQERYDARISVILVIVGMGQVTYFMNRAAYYNIDISHFSLILLVVIIIKRGMIYLKKLNWKNIKDISCYNLIKGTISGILIGILVILSTGTVVGGTQRMIARVDNGYWNYNQIVEFANTIKEKVPEDTYAFGLGVMELYGILGWQTRCYTLDFPDITLSEDAENYIREEVKEENNLFVAKEAYETYVQQDQFAVKEEFEYNGRVFYYCERVE
ncbi:MAG: hypothetical protein H2184_04545 [Candidatus Galacturonibacter soehngenii]|nr:hypothetical protein [Candidatus Galacturonibacter soehngenii]